MASISGYQAPEAWGNPYLMGPKESLPYFWYNNLWSGDRTKYPPEDVLLTDQICNESL